MFSRILNIGTRTDYEDWENTIARRINVLVLIATFNVVSTAAVFFPIGIYDLAYVYVTLIALTPFVFLVNYYWNYIAAAYCFFLITGWLLFTASYEIGTQSMLYLFFFPASYTMVQLFGRRELRVHVWMASTIYLVSFVATLSLWFFEGNSPLTAFQLDVVALVSIFLSFVSGLVIMILSNNDIVDQDQELRRLLKDKELLLAEVFHRVKNNMSIVTGLLSLRKETAVSEEAKNALEDCKSRVYSMAMIHQQMLNTDQVGTLDFKQYIWELAMNLNHSFGEIAKLTIDSVAVQMPISKAVPCGLIINELITNSYKHAIVPNTELHICVDIHFVDTELMITVSDNGPGTDHENRSTSERTLGFELIHSLCDQIDAKLEVQSENGYRVIFQFDMMS